MKPTDITMTLNPYFSIITLNVNGLNEPNKRHRVSEWIEKQDPSICCLQETHFRPEDTFRLKVRGWRTIYHATGSQKKAGVAILISDELHFKLKAVTTDISNLIDKNVVIAGDFNTPFTTMDRSSRHMVNKETRALNDTLDQMDLTDIFRTLHPKATEYTFF